MSYRPEIRGKHRWEKCNPEIMATGSQAAIRFALEDARHEILTLHARIEALHALSAPHTEE